MKNLKFDSLLKLLVVILVIGGFIITAIVVYDSLSRAARVDPALVESYRPHLDTNLIKKAAQALQEKGRN